MNETRQRIEQHVRDRPGIHFNGLVRELQLAPGQVQYHLKRLLRSDVLVSEPRDGRTHYFPPSYDPWERRVLSRYRRETSRDILTCLLENGPMRSTEVTDSVGIARSTLSWHTTRLAEDGIVERDKDARGRTILSLADPQSTAALLDEVTPSKTARATDRFTRLFDGLFEG